MTKTRPVIAAGLFLFTQVNTRMSLARIPVVLAVLLWASVTFAQADSARITDSSSVPVAPPPTYIISIDSVFVEGNSVTDTIDVVVDAYGSGIAGCALKIATDHYRLDILEILPGELPTSCRWKLFNARELSVQALPGHSGPAEMWQITALANTDPKGDTAICYALDHPASIARIVVMESGFSMGFRAPIFFYWESCRDNVISDPTGSSVIISESVTDRLPVELVTERDAFPTRYGTPDDCVSPRAYIAPQRLIQFINGGIEYRSSWEDAPASDSASDTIGH